MWQGCSPERGLIRWTRLLLPSQLPFEVSRPWAQVSSGASWSPAQPLTWSAYGGLGSGAGVLSFLQDRFTGSWSWRKGGICTSLGRRHEEGEKHPYSRNSLPMSWHHRTSSALMVFTQHWAGPRVWFSPRFLDLGAVDIFDWIVLCHGVFPVYCRMSAATLASTTNARSTSLVVTPKNVSNHCQVSPQGKNYPLQRTIGWVW